jgi:CheY-like chemotaxis protein
MSHSILVVDDNELNLKLAQQILTVDGYRVTAAARGQQAIEMACTHRPDLILLDIRLPDIDGLEVLRRLRSLPETKDVLIVAMTAQAMPDEIDRFVAAGCDGYIQKPISIQSFRAEVQRQLSTVAGDSPGP